MTGVQGPNGPIIQGYVLPVHEKELNLLRIRKLFQGGVPRHPDEENAPCPVQFGTV